MLLAVVASAWADIVATRVVSMPPEQVLEQAADLSQYPNWFPETCADRWDMGAVTQGVGASAFVRYRAAMWRRKLTMTVARVETLRVLIEHAGPKGFSTTWTVNEVEGGTEVELRTWLSAPNKPFQKYFEQKVEPAWTACYDEVLERFAQ